MSSQSEVSQSSGLLALVFSRTPGMANLGSYTTAPGQGSYPSSASVMDTGRWRIHGTWGHHTKAQTLPWKFLVLPSLIVSRVGDPQGMKILVSGLEWGLGSVSTQAAGAGSTIKPRLPSLFTPSLLLKPGPKLIKTK